ncbi:gliding motility-associated C-terminal domain-containing protein [Larkinella terrae]|uniref:T9SS type B sorting domain-containing protein n=1 Tax=Larkinella terrae TaxID=2025311 RepID=A0A7K0ENU7_9BACT|nr:gliding motility-associated C-terminal domain-containing protein [Larkinella terrae]MRS63402.1 T9SS type B sorting domain-containing protein [Larkinella terrae]
MDWCVNPPSAATKGGFSVSALKGCAPLTITVKNTTASPDNLFRYVYEYKGGDPIATNASVAATSYTFQKPGKYRILQLGSSGGTGSVACQEVEVLDATPPNFRAYSCADLKVVLDIVNDAVASQYDEFLVDWNDGSAIQTVPKTALAGISHTYLNNANYKIKVSGNYQGINCGGGSFQQVTPMLSSEFVKPIITRLTASGTTVTLQIQAGAKQTVTLYQKSASGTFNPTTISRVGNGPLVIANITSHPSCFMAVSMDACGQKFESTEVCSIGLEVTAKDQSNEVIWTAPGNPTNFQKYTVTRNDAAFRTLTSLSNNSITDKEGLNCNENYCYQVTALAGSTEIVSDRMCVTVRSSAVPPPFSTVQVSVNGDSRVDLRGLPPVPTSQNPSYKMIVFRRDQPGGSFAQTAEEIDRNIHQDGSVDPQKQSYCYEIVYQNACGVSSEHSKMVCTIYLSSNSAATIDWTGDSPFADEAIDHYIVEEIDESGTVNEFPPIPATTTSYRPPVNNADTKRYRYRVKAVSKSGAVSYSNFYTLLQAPRLFVPDAFTPNGDRDNNVLEVKGSTSFDSIQLTIYNRWGEVVFRGENREGWDGKIDGQPAPIGSYAYRVVAQDQNGLRTEKIGKVLLIR